MDSVKRSVLAVALVALLAMAAFGIYKGEFHETWYNGATL